MVTITRNQHEYSRMGGHIKLSTPDYGTDQYQPPIDVPDRDLLHRISTCEKN